MARKIIPVPGEGLQFVFDNDGLVHMKESVDTYNSLPITGNTENDVRITRDTDIMYTWSIAASGGTLNDWLAIGPISSVDWSAITNKPTSDVADIDDAVSKRHTQDTDQKLDDGGPNEVGVSDIKDSVDKKHTQNTDTGTTSETFAIDSDSSGFAPVKIKNENGAMAARNNADDDYVIMRGKDPDGNDDLTTKNWVETNFSTLGDIVKNIDNIMINAFRIAINGALTFFNMIDGIVDEYEDESGIDTGASINEVYDPTDDFYKPSGGDSVSSPFAHLKCNDDAANTTVTDDGTGANNGTATTNTNNLSVVGKINDAFEFNGSDEYVNLDTLEQDIDSDTTGSFSFWMNPTSLASNSYVLAFGDTNANAYMSIHVRSDGELDVTLFWEVDNGWSFRTTDASISAGSWFHIVLVQNGTAPVLYVNNSLTTLNFTLEQDKTAWFTNIEVDIDNGRLGCRNWNNLGNATFYNGKVDDFRYYQNITLSTDDISAIYNGGSGTEAQNPTSSVNDMTLISDKFTAEADPDNARIVMLEEDVDSITLNTDLIAYASKDDGATWAQITLSDEGDYDTSKRILVGNADLSVSGIGAGTDMVYKLETANNKALKIHGTALRWN